MPTEEIKGRTLNNLFSLEQRQGELFRSTYSNVHGGVEKGVIFGSLGALGARKLHSRRVSSFLSKQALKNEAEIIGKAGVGQIAASEKKLLESVSVKSDKLAETERMIESYLGEGTSMIKNKAGDPIFLSGDKQRRIRFDFNNTHGDRCHLHFEMRVNNRWKDATKFHRIYPME